MDNLIGDIYEAAVLPDRWPAVLAALGKRVGAQGGALFHMYPEGGGWIASPIVTEIMGEFIAMGFGPQNRRVDQLIETGHPGFLTDSHFFSTTEMEDLPLYRDFLIPRGIRASAATSVRGVTNDDLVLSIEGFESVESSRRALEGLNPFRPHLARAVMLSGQLALERARTRLDTLTAIGAPAAALGPRRQILAHNPPFQKAYDRGLIEPSGALTFKDLRADALLTQGLEQIVQDGGGRSFPVRAAHGAPHVAHLMPIHNAARDLFARTSAILVITEPTRTRAPQADLIQRLLDLTPAEARLAHLLAGGHDLQAASLNLGVSLHTARNQLRSVFAKTGLTRQAELTAMLATVGVWAQGSLPPV